MIDSLDTILPPPEQISPTVAQDPIHRYAAVIPYLQSRQTSQHPLTIRPVNTTTMAFKRKNQKLFEDIFQTMITMQP